ncbi:MAG: hypothetical protein H7301_14990 [Cryobacterium sp.]|nr:hypothetical protein [Oligoflexia bacterium]
MNKNFIFTPALFLFISFSGCSSASKSVAVPVLSDQAPSLPKVIPLVSEPKTATSTNSNLPPDRNNLMTCSSRDETRTLSIATKDAGCELVYEKNDKLNVPAYSAHGVEHCFNAREKIRKRLVSQGWKCAL